MRSLRRDLRIWVVLALILLVGSLDLHVRTAPARASGGAHWVTMVNYTCYPFLPSSAYIALAGSYVYHPLGNITELRTYVKDMSTGVVTSKDNTAALQVDPNDPNQAIYAGDTIMMPRATYRVWAVATVNGNPVVSNVYLTAGCGGTVTDLGWITP